MVFVVESVRIPAHSFMVDRSPVFKVALEGSFKEATTMVVNIEDASPKCFEPLIDFMYCDNFDWEENSSLDVHDLFAMGLLAKRYQMPDPCSAFLQRKFEEFFQNDASDTAELCGLYLAKSFEMDIPWVLEMMMSRLSTPKRRVKQHFSSVPMVPYEAVLNVLSDHDKMTAEASSYATQRAPLFKLAHTYAKEHIEITTIHHYDGAKDQAWKDQQKVALIAVELLQSCFDKLEALLKAPAPVAAPVPAPAPSAVGSGYPLRQGKATRSAMLR